jgi:hypothetical protein
MSQTAPAYLRPARAARRWPNDGTPPHPAKVVRSIVRGTASRSRPGQRIHLRAIRDSQGWLTTAEWIEEFIAELTADRLGAQAPNPMVEARGERAMARLSAQGW